MPSSNEPSDLYRTAVEQAAQTNGVDPDLVMKLIQQESGGDPHAVGRVTDSGQAHGLMQLMPENITKYGVTDPFDVTQNVSAGTKLLKELLDKYHGDTRLALVDYNGGPKAVAAYQAGKPFKETAGYLKGIMGDTPTRPDPFSLDDFVKAHDVKAPDTGSFDLDGFVKANAPSWTDRAVADVKNAATAVKNAAVETNPVTPILDAAAGFGKGALETSVDLAQLAHHIPGVSSVTGLTPEDFNNAAVRKPLEATTLPQKIGKLGERAAEFAVPGGAVDEAVMAGMKGAPALLRVLPRMMGQAAVGASEAGLHGESPSMAGAIASTGPVIGEIASLVAPVIQNAAKGMVRTSLKPTYALLSKMGGFEGAAPHADELVDFIVKNKLATPEEAEAFIQQLEVQKILPITSRATARGVTVPGAAEKVTQAITDFGDAPSLAPRDVKAAAASTLDNVQSGALYKDEVTPGAPVQVESPIADAQGNSVFSVQPGPDQVTRVPRLDITPDELLTAARNTKFTPTTVGTKLSPQDAVNNQVVTIARRELKDAVPELQAPFEEERMAINAKKALDRSSVREGNNNQIPLKTAIGLAGGPAGQVMGTGEAVLKLIGGVRAGLLAHQLGEALARQDVRSVLSIIRMSGYGAALDALPKQEAP